jgi:hypothetical protein
VRKPSALRTFDKLKLGKLEGEETFAGLQRFLLTVHRLTCEKRMSRYVYIGRKPGE